MYCNNLMTESCDCSIAKAHDSHGMTVIVGKAILQLENSDKMETVDSSMSQPGLSDHSSEITTDSVEPSCQIRQLSQVLLLLLQLLLLYCYLACSGAYLHLIRQGKGR